MLLWARLKATPTRESGYEKPRDGLTHRLLSYAKRSSDQTGYFELYSGLHESPGSMKDYGTMLLIATGFGIAAILRHLKELVAGYRGCEVVTRGIHVVWQLKGQGIRIYLLEGEC